VIHGAPVDSGHAETCQVWFQSARTPQEKDMLARQVESTDESIDRLVYALYGLSKEEIKIVEGK